MFRHVLAGAGGWGDPLERDVEAVLKDVRNELLSRAKAEADYGVVIDAQSWMVNGPRPSSAARRSGRGGVGARCRRCNGPIRWQEPASPPGADARDGAEQIGFGKWL